jgi:DNA excision repair protein ERCC-4
MTRFNERVKTVLATRTAEVVEMYQPMTDLMRQCQDSITECMEAMLVELKRDHSLVNDLLRSPSRAGIDDRTWT